MSRRSRKAAVRFRIRPCILLPLVIFALAVLFVLYSNVLSIMSLRSIIETGVWLPKATSPQHIEKVERNRSAGTGTSRSTLQSRVTSSSSSPTIALKSTATSKVTIGVKQQRSEFLRFSRRPETAHIECDRVLHEDKEYTEMVARNRTIFVERELDMTCDGLRKRIIPPKGLRPLKFGVAFARIVYMDYEFIEDELRSSYHDQNVFCYSIDSKANELFRLRIEKLERCLPNVVIAAKRFDVNSSGRFMNHAYYECLKLLVSFKGWGYALLMQNHDVMIKTVYETVAILTRLEGANDVHIRPCEDGRWDHAAKWDARSLKLYRNETLATSEQLNASLTMARGAVHASLSRAAVEWMVNTVDLTVLLDQLNTNRHGIDEVLIPTLQVSEIFDMPGRFTAECVKNGSVIGFITRIEIWSYDKLTPMCHSKKFRHSVCIYGIEDLFWLSRHPKIIANKMMPEFDYSAVDCMHEIIFNRTHLGQINRELNLSVYDNQPYVKYHKNRLRPDPNFKLDCSYGI